MRHRLQTASPQPWFLLLHLWELHHHRHILPQFRGRAHGHNRYERALSCLDAQLATLMNTVPPNTIVVVHGDHGEKLVKTDLGYRTYRLLRDIFGSSIAKREGHEMDVYEDLIRVPLVFSFIGPTAHPQLPAGKTVTQPVRQVDVLPTLIELAGLTPPSDIHGQSLVPALHADTPLKLEAYLEAFLRIHSDPRERRVGWRTAEWKYIYAPENPELPEELYHLASDPRERHNLIDTQPEVRLRLRQRIKRLQNGPLAANPGQKMNVEERRALEKRMADLGYLS